MRSKVNEKTNTVVDCRVKSQNQRVIRMLERIWELDPCDGPLLKLLTVAGLTSTQKSYFVWHVANIRPIFVASISI